MSGDGCRGSGSRRGFSLLSERARRVELALFIGLMYLLAASLVWAGSSFISNLEAHPSVLPITLRGAAAVLLGAVYILIGAGVLFSSWAMWRIFK